MTVTDRIMHQFKFLNFPRAIYSSLKFIYFFQILRGHSFRDKNGFCVTANAVHIPWYTYPAIDFLDTLDFSKMKVFEYGAGASTIWWSKRSKFVATVEMNVEWYQTVKKQNLPNVSIELCQDGGLYPKIISHYNQSFDIIAIDGAERFKSAVCAINEFSNNGFILLDNSDWYPNTANFLCSQGLNRIDFFGFCPTNSYPSVTSIFFRHHTNIFQQYEHRELNVMGGKILSGGALDDK